MGQLMDPRLTPQFDGMSDRSICSVGYDGHLARYYIHDNGLFAWVHWRALKKTKQSARKYHRTGVNNTEQDGGTKLCVIGLAEIRSCRHCELKVLTTWGHAVLFFRFGRVFK